MRATTILKAGEMSSLVFVITTDDTATLDHRYETRRLSSDMAKAFTERYASLVMPGQVYVGQDHASNRMASITFGLASTFQLVPAIAEAALREMQMASPHVDELRKWFIARPHRSVVIANARLLHLLGYAHAQPRQVHLVWTFGSAIEVVVHADEISDTDLLDMLRNADAAAKDAGGMVTAPDQRYFTVPPY